MLCKFKHGIKTKYSGRDREYNKFRNKNIESQEK